MYFCPSVRFIAEIQAGAQHGAVAQPAASIERAASGNPVVPGRIALEVGRRSFEMAITPDLLDEVGGWGRRKSGPEALPAHRPSDIDVLEIDGKPVIQEIPGPVRFEPDPREEPSAPGEVEGQVNAAYPRTNVAVRLW